jgi:DNA-binding NarL/FixJ family response regulator
MYDIIEPESLPWRRGPDFREQVVEPAVERAAARAVALQADTLHSTPHPLPEVWRNMVERRLYLLDSFSDEQRCYAIFRQVAVPDAAPLGTRDRGFLERNLLGESEKEIAFDCGLSISTIAGRLSRALRGMGLESRAARVPILVSVAVHAYYAKGRAQDGRMARISPGRVVISASRPDASLPGYLTAAERRVIALFVEGCSHLEIAQARRRSTRTIANQLATAFQKLGVSGRRPLLAHLLSAE